jgi:hypothetical protein
MERVVMGTGRLAHGGKPCLRGIIGRAEPGNAEKYLKKPRRRVPAGENDLYLGTTPAADGRRPTMCIT